MTFEMIYGHAIKPCRRAWRMSEPTAQCLWRDMRAMLQAGGKGA